LEEKIMDRQLRFVASLALVLALVGTASAADVTWNGLGADGLWSTGANWDTGGPPTADDDAYINMEPGAVIDDSVSADALDVILGNAAGETGRIAMTGGTLTVHKTGGGGPGLWVGNRGTGYFEMSGGTLVADNVYLPRNAPGQGFMTLSDGSVTVGNTFTLGLHHLEYGEFIMTGGTVEVASMFRCPDYGNAYLQITGGSIDVAGTFYIVRRGNNGGANTAGHVQLDGGTISVDDFQMDADNSGRPATMDITGGTLTIRADKTALINYYAAIGWITAYSGTGSLNVDLIDGNTVVTAEMGPAAWSPDPLDQATEVALDATLAWSAGMGALQHDVYFGTSFEDVNAASDPDVLPGRGRQESTTYDPGALTLGRTYYWRVDEVGEDEAVVRGSVWSFTALSSLLVDDFERYHDESPNRVFQTWVDGYGFSADEHFPDGHPGNGSGMGVGHDVWTPGTPYTSIMEVEIVHGGAQSMPLYYNNTEGVTYSEAERTFETAQDWTAAGTGVRALSLWFYGNLDNVADRMYVAVEDSTGARATVPYENPNAVVLHAWQEWNIDLAQFADAGVDLAHVQKICIGVGDRDGASSGSTGRIFIDDIRLYPSRCVPEYAPAGDLDGDCDVDYQDLQILMDNWLESFVWDVTGGYDGSGCLQLDGSGERLFVPGAPFPREAFTYSLWFSPAALMDADSDVQYLFYWSPGGPSGGNRPALTHNQDGSGRLRVNIMLETMSSTDEGVAYTDSRSFDPGTWYHVAFTFDGDKTRVYVNGQEENVLVYSGVHLQRYNPGVYFGARSDGTYGFNGKLDDIRIYAHALSAADITGLVESTSEPAPGPAAWYKLDETVSASVADASGNGYDGYVLFVEPYTNPYDDNEVGLKDYAVLAQNWLAEQMWP
jgi:hypothetical protein